MDYDYGPPSAPPVIAVDGLDPMPFRMTIYGPCSNPTVTIGGNQYRITGDIPGGARVEVDAVEGERSVAFVNAAGDRVNWFANAERGAGLDSGSYIFQPLPAGRAEVSWPGATRSNSRPSEERRRTTVGQPHSHRREAQAVARGGRLHARSRLRQR